MKQSIIIRTNFNACHRYSSAPEKVSFLRNYHRHIFTVEVQFKIKKERQLEFFIIKEKLNRIINIQFSNKHLEYSCETMATIILKLMKSIGAYKVKVFEDDENGAVIEL